MRGQVAAGGDEFPWHAAIFLKSNDGLEYIFGGTLIQGLVIVTAAHCVGDDFGMPIDTKNFRIVLGGSTSTFERILDDPQAQVVYVIQFNKVFYLFESPSEFIRFI